MIRIVTTGEIPVRPRKSVTELEDVVRRVLADVKERGDVALREYEERFDNVALESFLVSPEEFDEAETLVSLQLKEAILQAHHNIEKFHSAQRFSGEKVNVSDGVQCWQRAVAIEKVGLYIPGGTAPLFSTVLMLATPAKIAGCREIILCTPPQKDGKVNPAVLVAARVAGVGKVYKLGGVQAIAAMAYGTETVPQVSKIFGPGNQFVMTAKMMVSMDGTAIDMPAGPSEVAVVADRTCHVDFVAADLLSQAEHGTDSQSVLFTDSMEVAQRVADEVERQLQFLPRKEIASQALDNSAIIVVESIAEAMSLCNEYAPEHLILAMDDAEQWADCVVNAGSVFLGHWASESAGDYASGTNHTLPTSGYAKAYSGVNLDSYMRKITFQKLSPEGVREIGAAVETMAAAEGLDAHRNAMTLRCRNL